TDYHRLGTANINNIPINQPIVEPNNNQRDGHVRHQIDMDMVCYWPENFCDMSPYICHQIDMDMVTYHKNSLANNTPTVAAPEASGTSEYPEQVEGHITRKLPSDLFDDHFSQARLFWNSLSEVERQDLIKSFSFH